MQHASRDDMSSKTTPCALSWHAPARVHGRRLQGCQSMPSPRPSARGCLVAPILYAVHIQWPGSTAAVSKKHACKKAAPTLFYYIVGKPRTASNRSSRGTCEPPFLRTNLVNPYSRQWPMFRRHGALTPHDLMFTPTLAPQWWRPCMS